MERMDTIFPLNPRVQELTDYLATQVLFALSCNDDRRQCVEEYVADESQDEVKFETEDLQYTQSSHIQFAHFLATHVLREEDRREHSNLVDHVEKRLFPRLQARLQRCRRQSDPELGEVYFLEDIVCSLNRWIATQKDNAQLRQRVLAETKRLNNEDLHVL